MKNTKYLFDEENQTPEGMVSVSQLQSFMSCPKKWEYGYVENLAPRVERPYLGVGKLCHKGMEHAMRGLWAYDSKKLERPDNWKDALLGAGICAMELEWKEYMDSNPFLEEEIPAQEQVLTDAKAVFTQALGEFDLDRWEVLTVYKDGEAIPALELHFVVPCAGSKGLHGYIDAILRERKTGHVWCTDYKFRKSLSPDEEEETNIQNAVYTHACKKMGINITGTMTWQHVNTPASNPAILKSGTVSRSKIKTTWAHYEAFCRDRGIDPEPYRAEMEEKLADIEWYRPTFEYRNDQTVKNMWNQIIVPATYAVKSAYTKAKKGKNPRNLYPWNCKMCQYKDLCQAELRNHDAEFLRKSEYVHRTHGRTPDPAQPPESAEE